MRDPNLEKILMHIRHAMMANKYGTPVYPALRAAEEMLLLELFGKEETEAYYADGGGSESYRPFSDP